MAKHFPKDTAHAFIHEGVDLSLPLFVLPHYGEKRRCASLYGGGRGPDGGQTVLRLSLGIREGERSTTTGSISASRPSRFRFGHFHFLCRVTDRQSGKWYASAGRPMRGSAAARILCLRARYQERYQTDVSPRNKASSYQRRSGRKPMFGKYQNGVSLGVLH